MAPPLSLIAGRQSRRAPSWRSWGRISHFDIHSVQPPGLFFSKPVLHTPPMFQCPNHPSRTGVLVEQGHVYVYIAVGVSDGLNIWSDTFAPIPRRSRLFASVGQPLLEGIY
ncbi:hypothetical protein ACN38_g9197 [Penicillium nordicum]|uniref:Uncharacterized protein n=1 Tax=Penicillium nordicum TaxID=229535 RepID=A0A0M9WD26_9EURO|nr:hypothetical protein ACN38_g9197 [Penicillium nordicum]